MGFEEKTVLEVLQYYARLRTRSVTALANHGICQRTTDEAIQAR